MSMQIAISTARAKRAAAEKGYVVDPFASQLCEAEPAGDPLLHRGYYARHRAVDLALRAFLREFPAPRRRGDSCADFFATTLLPARGGRRRRRAATSWSVRGGARIENAVGRLTPGASRARTIQLV